MLKCVRTYSFTNVLPSSTIYFNCVTTYRHLLLLLTKYVINLFELMSTKLKRSLQSPRHNIYLKSVKEKEKRHFLTLLTANTNRKDAKSDPKSGETRLHYTPDVFTVCEHDFQRCAPKTVRCILQCSKLSLKQKVTGTKCYTFTIGHES